MEVGGLGGLNPNGIRFGSVNSGVNTAQSWIGAVYNANYSSDLRFYISNVGNTAYTPNQAFETLILRNQNNSYGLAYLEGGLSVGTSLPADPGNGGINAAGNISAGGGTNILYRCTTAGTLPIGALTTATGSCGASVDTGLRVK